MNSLTMIAFAVLAVIAANAQVVPITVVNHQEVRDSSGQFSFTYTGSDGTTVSESGRLVLNRDGTDLVLVKEGSYSYYDLLGQLFKLKYTADEDGFHPVADYLPVAPPAQ